MTRDCVGNPLVMDLLQFLGNVLNVPTRISEAVVVVRRLGSLAFVSSFESSHYLTECMEVRMVYVDPL